MSAAGRSPHVLRTGRQDAGPPRRTLWAGPVTAVLDGPDLRNVRRGGRELAQRIYVAVRDEGWGTTPAEVTDVQVDQRDDGFRVTFTARHVEGPIDVEWQAEIVGEADGTIAFGLDGVAHGTFRFNKIGFNVHHPLLESVGRAIRATAADGTELAERIDPRIEPQRVVDGVLTGMFPPYSALAIDYGDGAEVRFAFEGDLFEMQDHRNWADGNFKSYGTPFAVPLPLDAVPGQRFSQRVVVASVGLGDGDGEDGPVTVGLGARTARALPRIGLGQPTHGLPLTAREARLVRVAAPRHLRVNARLHEADWPDRVRNGAADCSAVDARAELAVSLTPGDDDALAALATLVGELDLAVERVLVLEAQDAFTPTAPITTEDSLRRARAHLRPVVGDAPFAGGSDQFFSDVNRAPPPEAGLDAVCFGLCPQVHAGDDASLMENLPALADCVSTSRSLRPGLPVAVSPLTLVPRLGPFPAGAPVPGGLPGAVDPRQFGLYGASWTLGAIAWLAGVDTESVTFYETTGPQGVVEREAGSPQSGLLPVGAGEAFPLLHVLADVAEWRDATLVETVVSEPLVVSALAVAGADARGVLLASHAADPRRVVVRGLGVETVRVRRLDETTAEEAITAPGSFRAQGDELPSPGGELELELAPYAVVRIET